MAGATSAIPPNWTIFGIAGPLRSALVDRLSANSGGVLYEHGPFPKTITPSPLLPTYTQAAEIAVLSRFEGACRQICGKCATHAPCNAYFATLGAGLSLADLLAWHIRISYWGPVSKAGGEEGGVMGAEFLRSGTTANGEPWAMIAVTEVSLRSDIALAATLVHELAHVAGAPGATEEQRAALGKKRQGAEYERPIRAERALQSCLLPKQFDPGALGVLQGPEWRGSGSRVV